MPDQALPELAPLRVPDRAAGRGAVFASVAAALPERVVSNAEIAGRLGIDEDWIVSRTGIRERRHALPDERLSDLAARAGSRALERAGLDPAELELVLVATMTADEQTPNAAPLVAEAIGARGAGAFDVGAACTAWLSGVSMVASQIEAGRARNGLVVGADLISRVLDLDDRSTAGLLADGAGATVIVGRDGASGIAPVALRSDGSQPFLIHCAPGGKVSMDGPEVYRHAVRRLVEVTHEALEASGLALDDVDLFVYHQANQRITRAVGARLGIEPERVVDCIAGMGNNSAATLPIALATAFEDGRLRDGTRVLLATFGAGFTWGGAVVEWGRGDG